MITKNFSMREKFLLLVLAVILVAAVYYFAIQTPTVEAISQAEVKISEVQDLLVVEEAKAEQVKTMQEALAQVSADTAGTTIIPVYDNLQNLLEELYAVLSPADQYKLNFSNVVIQSGVAERKLQLIFYASDYYAAKRIIREFYSGSYRCDITSLKLTPEQQDSGSLLEVPVIVTMEIVYYELCE